MECIDNLLKTSIHQEEHSESLHLLQVMPELDQNMGRQEANHESAQIPCHRLSWESEEHANGLRHPQLYYVYPTYDEEK